jgi:hypothetical protein
MADMNLDFRVKKRVKEENDDGTIGWRILGKGPDGQRISLVFDAEPVAWTPGLEFLVIVRNPQRTLEEAVKP